MAEKKTKTKPKSPVETQIAESLTPAAAVVLSKDEAVNNLLSAIYEQAVGGNTAAAKLYLDYCLKQASEDPSAIDTDEIYRLLREFASK